MSTSKSTKKTNAFFYVNAEYERMYEHLQRTYGSSAKADLIWWDPYYLKSLQPKNKEDCKKLRKLIDSISHEGTVMLLGVTLTFCMIG